MLFGIIVLSVLIWIAVQNYFKKEETIYIAFIGPMSGEGASAGKLMTNAIQLYIDTINKSRDKVNGKKIELEIFDDKNDCSGQAKTEAKKIVDNNQVVAVIGHWYSGCSISGGAIYNKYGLPAITPGSVKKEVTENNEWYFRNIYTAKTSGRFLAHYVDKVFKRNKVAIISDGTGFGSYLAEVFDEAARRLGMDIKNWNYDFNFTENKKKQYFNKLVAQLKSDSQETQVIMLAMQAGDSVKLVKLIKEANINKIIIGGSSLSEDTFKTGFDGFPREKTNPGYYTNDIYVATPLLFDTANEEAQKFKEAYEDKYQGEDPPDWSAAYAYDTAMVLIRAIRQADIKGQPETLKADRSKIRKALASFTNINEAIEGTTGFNYFNDSRDAQKPVAMGVYKNKSLVSALTQFQTMRNPNEISDLDAALENERVLKIDGNYFYKTNVVYTGIKVNEISDINFKDLTFTLDFHLWFRFAGRSKPEKIEFLNATEPDKIMAQLDEKPIDKKNKGQITYRVYRIRSNFRADFLNKYTYKQHTFGVNFHHRSLTRNNLIYVTDVLGMGETKESEKIQEYKKVLSPALGWSIEKIRYFQDVAKKYSLGDPEYLNVQGGTIEYSRFNAGIQIKKNELTLRGKIPWEYAYNLMVVSIIIIFALNIVSRKFRSFSKWIWFLQTIIAFILLISSEVLLVDWLSRNLETYNVEFFIKVFDILWWLIPAFLLNMASENFIWTPIEEKTGRLIPNIVRLFLAFIIYFLSVVGIIAFVYGQALTSILATSGVIAMIIGLAIQINISNIFSGIAINIERPFRIGDWVKIGEFDEGEIVDITWRTTRLKTRAECILSIPNSMASETPILNFCYPDNVYWLWPTVYVHPIHPPSRVRKILLDALLSAGKVLKEPAPVVLFTGINEWAASYWIAFCADNYSDKNFILEDVWTRVWFHLNRAGITPAVTRQEIHLFKGVKERGGEEATKPITLLQEVDIFKPFSEEAKLYLSEKIRRHRFGPGEIVVKQGDAGDSLFIIVEGVVAIQVQTDDGISREVARLGAGNFFGEMALLTGEVRTATVIAIVDTYLFELTKADIKPLFEEQPEVPELVSKVLTQRQMITQRYLDDEPDEIKAKTAVYKQFLNRIEQFFGIKDGIE